MGEGVVTSVERMGNVVVEVVRLEEHGRTMVLVAVAEEAAVLVHGREEGRKGEGKGREEKRGEGRGKGGGQAEAHARLCCLLHTLSAHPRHTLHTLHTAVTKPRAERASSPFFCFLLSLFFSPHARLSLSFPPLHHNEPSPLELATLLLPYLLLLPS